MLLSYRIATRYESTCHKRRVRYRVSNLKILLTSNLVIVIRLYLVVAKSFVFHSIWAFLKKITEPLSMLKIVVSPVLINNRTSAIEVPSGFVHIKFSYFEYSGIFQMPNMCLITFHYLQSRLLVGFWRGTTGVSPLPFLRRFARSWQKPQLAGSRRHAELKFLCLMCFRCTLYITLKLFLKKKPDDDIIHTRNMSNLGWVTQLETK